MQKMESLYLKKDNEIATIYLNRPEKRNAFNLEMWKRFPELLEEAESDPQIKVLILRGVDKTAFCSGADISEFKEVRANDEQAESYNKIARLAVNKLTTFIKPTIALIQGPCVGGGNELALTCDFRFTDSTGRFGITPAKLGIIYGLSATKRLFDVVGPIHTKEILMTGRILNAEEAFNMGLVDKLYSSAVLEEETLKFAKMISANSQLTVRATKKIVKELLNGVLHETEEIKQMVLDSYNSEDYKEGVKAFMEKRKPNFKYS